MAASEIEQWWIDKFQENLGPIRKVAGWTTQQLADELGVARQTVSNLETGKSPMTKLQYLALRTVFSAEIARREDRDLARIIKTLVDDPIEQRIRERRAQEQDGEAVADNAPVNTGLWQRCRQRRHRETQAQCRHIEGFKDCRNGQAHAQHGDAGSCRHHRRIGQWNRRRHHHLLDVPGRRPEQALSRRNIETD